MPDDYQSITSCTDEELVKLFQEGNKGAFTALVKRYKDPLVNYVYRFLGDYDDANDIVQDAFIRVYRHIDQYQPVAKFSTWLYTIATNLSRTHYRKQTKWGLFSFFKRDEEGEEWTEDIKDSAMLPDELTQSAMIRERIEQALMELTPSFREVVILFEIEDKSYEEICEITGLNIGTVKSRLNRGRRKLQEMLHDLIDDARK